MRGALNKGAPTNPYECRNIRPKLQRKEMTMQGQQTTTIIISV